MKPEHDQILKDVFGDDWREHFDAAMKDMGYEKSPEMIRGGEDE